MLNNAYKDGVWDIITQEEESLQKEIDSLNVLDFINEISLRERMAMILKIKIKLIELEEKL